MNVNNYYLELNNYVITEMPVSKGQKNYIHYTNLYFYEQKLELSKPHKCYMFAKHIQKLKCLGFCLDKYLLRLNVNLWAVLSASLHFTSHFIVYLE